MLQIYYPKTASPILSYLGTSCLTGRVFLVWRPKFLRETHSPNSVLQNNDLCLMVSLTAALSICISHAQPRLTTLSIYIKDWSIFVAKEKRGINIKGA